MKFNFEMFSTPSFQFESIYKKENKNNFFFLNVCLKKKIEGMNTDSSQVSLKSPS